MEKFKLTPEDKKIANEAFKSVEHLKQYRRIEVTYSDGHVKKFPIETWLMYRSLIRERLFKKGLCKIKPIGKRDNVFKRLWAWLWDDGSNYGWESSIESKSGDPIEANGKLYKTK